METPKYNGGKTDAQHFRLIVRLIIASYNAGWFVLALKSLNVPFSEPIYWHVASYLMIVLTTWLAVTASIRALTWWETCAVLFASVRSSLYVADNFWSPLGVWLLALSGIAVTVLAMLSSSALSGDLEVRKT